MKLFIIGNGFDVYLHGLPTKYSDFRNYIISRYPNAKDNYFVPESVLYPDGTEKYDIDEVVGYIVNVIDCCGNEDWNELEFYLGSTIYDEFENDLPDIDINDDDGIFRNMRIKESMSKDILNIFETIKSLFNDWVKNELINLDYNRKYKKSISSILSGDSIFLNFNYTETLEKVYGISEKKVRHIHGKVNDNSEVIFGHGDNDPIPDSFDFIGSDIAYSELKEKLRKDVNNVLYKNRDFFNNLGIVNEIYSHGFSFSDVDMVYIEEIAKNVSLKDTIWYLNNYDWKNKIGIKNKLEALGFVVKRETRW